MLTAPDRTSPHVTRLAPSPTGSLHLGNARTFLINWALARQNDWSIHLRIEDLDITRTRDAADQQAIDILTWLGIDWDTGPTYQTHDLTPYRDALLQLARAGEIYPCTCTRKDIALAQSAPHDDDGDPHQLRYPGTHRPPEKKSWDNIEWDDPTTAWRLIVPDTPIEFTDAFMGPQSFRLDHITGDFVVSAKSGLPAYQLAVVIDDHASGVTQVVRGDDLLSSTPRQMLVYQRLGLHPIPTYTHVPLVLGSDGRRLAKRHGDNRLVTLRDAHVDPHRLIGLIASWSGVTPPGKLQLLSADDFAKEFSLNDLPTSPAVLTQVEYDWLITESNI